MAGNCFYKQIYNIFFLKKKANRITFTRFSLYTITANMAHRSQRGKRKDERSTEDEVAWNGMAGVCHY